MECSIIPFRFRLRLYLTLLLLGFFCNYGFSQLVESDERALIGVNDGLGFKKDSLFFLNLRFRIQNRAGYNNVRGDNTAVDIYDFKVRRMRLRLDGYVIDQRFQYYVQLAFSRADMDLEFGERAQPLRDAIVYYNFTPNFYVGFGQSKLPGNRQRVISSGNLQFADRSVANAFFNIDRDFGVFGYYTMRLHELSLIQLKGAVSTGQGRNSFNNNEGFAYTGRVEYLPFGEFLNSGDYSEGDLEFEWTPKLSLAFTLSKNHKATRAGGQTGLVLFEERNLDSFIIDAAFKYRGWSLMSEYLQRDTANPITQSEEGDLRHVLVGHGMNHQLSKMVGGRSELAIRYSYVSPSRKMEAFEADIDELILGYTKYFNGHRIKLQGNLGYRWVERSSTIQDLENGITAAFQVEFGI